MNFVSNYFNWLQKNNPKNIVESYPEIDEQKETSVPGVYIVGDLTGIPLLKLAADGGAKNCKTTFSLTRKLASCKNASFLPDDEVVPSFDVDDALDSDDVCHNYYKYLDGSEKASNHILEQTSILVEELDGFCQENGL